MILGKATCPALRTPNLPTLGGEMCAWGPLSPAPLPTYVTSSEELTVGAFYPSLLRWRGGCPKTQMERCKDALDQNQYAKDNSGKRNKNQPRFPALFPTVLSLLSTLTLKIKHLLVNPNFTFYSGTISLSYLVRWGIHYYLDSALVPLLPKGEVSWLILTYC